MLFWFEETVFWVEKNICQQLSNYLEMHMIISEANVLLSNNSTFIKISITEYAELPIKILI